MVRGSEAVGKRYGTQQTTAKVYKRSDVCSGQHANSGHHSVNQDRTQVEIQSNFISFTISPFSLEKPYPLFARGRSIRYQCGAFYTSHTSKRLWDSRTSLRINIILATQPTIRYTLNAQAGHRVFAVDSHLLCRPRRSTLVRFHSPAEWEIGIIQTLSTGSPVGASRIRGEVPPQSASPRTVTTRSFQWTKIWEVVAPGIP